MKHYPLQEIVRNFLAVVAGVLVGIGICYLLLRLLEDWFLTDNIPSLTALYIIVFSGLAFAAVLAGFLASVLSTRRKVIHGVIAGLVGVIIMMSLYMPAPDDQRRDHFFFWISLVLLVSGSWAGGLLGLRFKRKKL